MTGSPKCSLKPHLPLSDFVPSLSSPMESARQNPAYLEHFLHQNFPNYINELLGDGIFNIDGHPWTLQRKIASHEFNTRSLKHFISFTVNSEISNSLIPYLSSNEDKVIDLQDVSQRFRSDNICHVAFGVNPTCLTSYNMYQNSPSSNFVKAFNVAVEILLMIMIAPEQRTGTTSSRKKMIWFKSRGLEVEDEIWELPLVFWIFRKRTVSLMCIYETLRLVRADD